MDSRGRKEDTPFDMACSYSMQDTPSKIMCLVMSTNFAKFGDELVPDVKGEDEVDVGAFDEGGKGGDVEEGEGDNLVVIQFDDGGVNVDGGEVFLHVAHVVGGLVKWETTTTCCFSAPCLPYAWSLANLGPSLSDSSDLTEATPLGEGSNACSVALPLVGSSFGLAADVAKPTSPARLKGSATAKRKCGGNPKKNC
ncbi:hypothetical protein VNO78_05896 [Psophocarpus tetragonolobus]|uniref:Uncharacterized protein n=1 Tax=Psophocarpus tetragonolobus TaxID=3891 RepID=A0AAN9XQR8_PSOTE